MNSNELALAFVRECLEWRYGIPHGWAIGPIWFTQTEQGVLYVTCDSKELPPFGEDTPDGYAAFRRWVEPWIEEQLHVWWYQHGCFKIVTIINVDGDYLPIVEVAGPLPTAAIKACLELVRKEKRDE